MKRVEVAIAIVCKQGTVLICRRRLKVHLGGFWEFPGGKIEAGESPAECLARELREEVQIEVEALTALEAIEYDYPDRNVCLHPFLCAYKSGRAVAVGCESLLWVESSALQNYEFPPANNELIKMVVRLMSPE